MIHNKHRRKHKGRGPRKQSSSDPSIRSLGLNKNVKRGIRNYAKNQGIELKTLGDLARLGTHTVSFLPGIGHETIVRLQLCATEHNIPWTHSEIELKAKKADAEFFQALLMADLSPVIDPEDEGV
jgi:hypothetical protein